MSWLDRPIRVRHVLMLLIAVGIAFIVITAYEDHRAVTSALERLQELNVDINNSIAGLKP